MSVADSSITLFRPTSTVVAGRNSEIHDRSNAEDCKEEKDEAYKREKCAWYENKLDLARYVREKNNEERVECDGFIRINSRILRRSYHIPASEIYPFLKKLFNILAPGMRIVDRNVAASDDEVMKRDGLGKRKKILSNWSSCTDFSVQVFPKSPTVFWLDLECMQCKRGNGTEGKHMKSKKIIETVVAALRASDRIASTVVGEPLLLYITRGRTCGMHLFFPDIVCESVEEMECLWDSVNRHLAAAGLIAATVDTGCSALPLPLSRYHNGLTRVEVSFADDQNVKIVPYELTRPSIRDLARISNFYHLVADIIKTQKPTPPSSAIGSTCTSGGRKPDGSVSPATDVSQPPLRNTTTDRDVDQEETRSGGYASSERKEASDAAVETYTAAAGVVTSDNGTASSHDDGGETIVDLTGEREDQQQYDYCDERDSVVVSSSTSSKRLVQADIRTVCSKAKKRTRSAASSVENDALSESKRSRPSTVADEKHRPFTDLLPVTLHSKMSSWFANSDDAAEPNTTLDRDDAASSLAYRGQASSVKTFTTTDNSLFRTEDVEETAARETKSWTTVSAGIAVDEQKQRVAENDNRPSASSSEALSNVWSSSTQSVRDLYVADDSVPDDASLPRLHFDAHRGEREDDRTTKDAFRKNMEIPFPNTRHNSVHQTDIQLLLSNFNSELDFYVSTMENAVPLNDGGGLRTKPGSSLNAGRDGCPTALFPQNVPHVLYAEDYVGQREWLTVLVRYYDEYLNEAAFLHVMASVLQQDENVKKNMSESSRREIHKCVNNCLARFKNETIEFQRKLDTAHRGKATNIRKHPYGEKCTVVVGLIAVCSLAFKMVTPIFTDLVKICHLLLSNNQQTLRTLNQSTMSTTTGTDDYSFDSAAPLDEDPILSVSASQVDAQNYSADCVGVERGEEESAGACRARGGKNVPASIGNYHSIIASLLRWNYNALDVQTRWCLFFYYYHVHTDGLTRITNEMVHGGVMVAAVLHAYFEESVGRKGPVTVSVVCSGAFRVYRELERPDEPDDNEEEEKRLMPPPPGRQLNRRSKGTRGASKTASSQAKKGDYERRHEDAKKAQRKVQEGRGEKIVDKDDRSGGNGDGKAENESSNSYRTSFGRVFGMIMRRYLRPVAFDESVVLYTESGYEQCQNELSGFFSLDKEVKKLAMDIYKRETMKYVMPHGDLLMYNTDVLGTVHRRSSCTNNLVLNIFENVYGGCMTYLTRRFNNNLKLLSRFNGDAYRLVVECRHAMIELIQSIELSYMNLILRQPIVPPILETDARIREMFMSSEDLLDGAFVSLNAMDYVRAVNMFTKHSRFSQENYRSAESFLDKLITKTGLHEDVRVNIDEEACQRFRTTYLFFLLYIFEVLYKIRHVYNKDRTYNVSIEQLSWDLDVRLLLKLFFGAREFKMPRGLSLEALLRLDMTKDVYEEATTAGAPEDDFQTDAENNAAAAGRCINTRPLVSTSLPDKMTRMMELFGKKGIMIMKSYAPLNAETAERPRRDRDPTSPETGHRAAKDPEFDEDLSDVASVEDGVGAERDGPSCVERESEFLKMTQARLEEALYSSATWYENCRVRVKATRARARDKEGGVKRIPGELETSMDARSMDTFLRTQLRVNIDNGRLEHVQRAVRDNKDFAFCTLLPLRAKTMALVLASHATKRLTDDVAADFVRKEYYFERSGVIRVSKGEKPDGGIEEDGRPDLEWGKLWKRLLAGRLAVLKFGRMLAEAYFPNNYFIGLQPEKMYDALFDYMSGRPEYTTFHALQNQSWTKDVCVALNYLLVMNAYDPELVELCMRLFLGLEWPGQWAKRIFVWKSNSNAGKSVLFENVIGKAFDQSTCINDPKGGKENAPEKSEYYKNFVLMINEFTSASACELKKLCSTSSYKFRMNFGNQMIQAFMVGKMVFNCNTLPLTTDHATIQRVALVPLPFWFQKRQSVVDSMLNWTLGQSATSEYERNFRRNVSTILSEKERHFFIRNRNTKGEEDLFNKRNETPSLQTSGEYGDRSARASVFMVQNKTSQMYMSNPPPTNSIISGVVIITRYFSRFRFFNNIKEPVDYSVLPTACTAAAQEWQRISQPYFDWKDRYRVQKDYTARTKISTIHASLNHFAKNYSKNVSFFDLRQFFEWDFAEQKIPYYNAKEDEYNVTLDPFQE